MVAELLFQVVQLQSGFPFVFRLLPVVVCFVVSRMSHVLLGALRFELGYMREVFLCLAIQAFMI